MLPSRDTLIDVTDPSTPISRLEYVPNPGVTVEEHLNTSIDIEMRRLRFILDKALGKAILSDGMTVSYVGGNIVVSTGTMISGYYLVQNQSVQNLGAPSTGTYYVTIRITESIHDADTNPNEIVEDYGGVALSGPNRYWYSTTFQLEASIVSDVEPFPVRLTGYTPLRVIQLATVVNDGMGNVVVTQNVKQVKKLGEYVTVDLETRINTMWDYLFASTAPAILNFRVTDVDIERSELVENAHYAMLDDTGKQGNTTNRAMYSFKWNWDSITGYGGTGGQFWITNLTGISINQFIDFGILIGASDYTISSNDVYNGTTVRLIVTDSTGTNPNLSGLTNVTNAMIHSRATGYQIIATPYAISQSRQLLSTLVEDRAYDVKMEIDSYHMAARIPLEIGVTYKIQITAFRGNIKGSTTVLQSGTYYKYSGSHSYGGGSGSSAYVTAELAIIPTESAALAVATTDYGFQAEISGWSHAQQFEWVWNNFSEAGVLANFSNPKHEKRRSPTNMVNIPTTSNSVYSLAVRPLIGVYQVDTPIFGKVTSGGGGVIPLDQVIANKDVRLITYSGNIAYNGTTGAYTISVIMSPALSSNNVSSQVLPPDTLVGDIITFNSVAGYYLITDSDGWVIKLEPVGSAPAAPTTGLTTFQIGTSKLGRQIWTSGEINVDLQLKKLSFACDNIRGGTSLIPGILRVYQSNFEDLADYVLVTSKNATSEVSAVTGGDIRVDILAQQGPRVIFMDFWDPTGTPSQYWAAGSSAPNNVACIFGEAILKGVPKKVTTSTRTSGATSVNA